MTTHTGSIVLDSKGAAPHNQMKNTLPVYQYTLYLTKYTHAYNIMYIDKSTVCSTELVCKILP